MAETRFSDVMALGNSAKDIFWVVLKRLNWELTNKKLSVENINGAVRGGMFSDLNILKVAFIKIVDVVAAKPIYSQVIRLGSKKLLNPWQSEFH